MRISTNIKEFTYYLNMFYGIKGIYSSGRDVSKQEVSKAIKILKADSSIEFQGDTIDRERARDIIFTEEEIAKIYK